MQKKAQAFAILIFIIALIVIGLAMSILMKPMKVVYDKTYQDDAVQEDVYQEFYTRSKTVWIWLPFMLGIPLVIWVLIKAHEKGQYG